MPSTFSIPFKLKIDDAKTLSLKDILDSFRITSPILVDTILRNDVLREKVFQFNFDFKTGKEKVDKNPGGLLLTKLGLIHSKKLKKVNS